MSKVIKQLNISFVYDDSLDGTEGVTQQVKVFGEWLSSRGHQVSYIVGQTNLKVFNNSPIYSITKNLKVKFNGNRLSIPLPASSRSVKKVLKQVEPDILHIQMPHSPFMAQKVINLSSPKTVKIGTFHIFPANALASIGTRLLKLAYFGGIKKIDKLYSVSSAAQSFAKHSMNLNTEILPNVIDANKFISKEKNKPQRIVFLGRLVERKGARELLKAFQLVGRAQPNAELVIAGIGPQREELVKLASSLGIDNKVRFLGFIEEKDKPKLLASAEIACFPSLYGESFGIVLIEAMAAGAGVVIGGDNPGYASVLEDNQEALIDPKNTSEFAELICSYLSDKNKQQRIHGWQKQLYPKFDVNIVGAKLEAAYYSEIAKKNNNSHN